MGHPDTAAARQKKGAQALNLLFGLWAAWWLLAGLDEAVAAENDSYPEQPAWFKQSFLDLREDVAEAAAAGKRVLLYFHQDGCPYCARLIRENFGDPRLADKTRRHFDVIAINIWGDREVTDLEGRETTEKAFARSLGVQYTPTLIFLDEQGRPVARLNGYYPPDKFEIVLDYVAGHHEKEQSLADYYRARTAAKRKARLPRESFFMTPPLRLDKRPPGKHLAVLFEEPGCAACRELHQDHFHRPEVLRALANLDVAQVDPNADTPLVTPDGRRTTMADWARALEVQYLPGWVFFDDQGREVFRTDAWLRPFHLSGVLDYVATGAYRWQPSFQRFLRHRSDVLRSGGVEVDLMK